MRSGLEAELGASRKGKLWLRMGSQDTQPCKGQVKRAASGKKGGGLKTNASKLYCQDPGKEGEDEKYLCT